MHTKTISTIMVCSLLTGSVGAYFGSEWKEKQLSAVETANGVTTPIDGNITPEQEEKIRQAFSLIHDSYVEEMSDDELVAGAIEGMVQTLNDPYSVYMDAETATRFQQTLQSSFEGIGAEVTVQDGKLVIVSPFKGSPAEKAGLKPLDQILAIDGQSVEGLDLVEATMKIRGEKGSTVQIQIKRKGLANPLTVVVKRDEIPVETVKTEMVTKNEKTYGVIEVSSFSEHTAEDFLASITDLEAKKVAGIIIDVRGNPGGLLSAVEKMIQPLVTAEKPYVQIQERNGETTGFQSNNAKKKPYPIAVLMDKGSASASEILAAALQEAGGYPLVGETSFGKGTVQQPMELSDKSTIKLTMAKWLTPNGNWIHGKGIKPTVEVQQPAIFHAHLLQLSETLKREMNNEEVLAAQEMLAGLGYDPGRTDGYYSIQTEKAVRDFQVEQNIIVSGQIDKQTAMALEEQVRAEVNKQENDLQLAKAVEILEAEGR